MPALSKAKQTKVKSWLKNHGHSKTRVDVLKIETEEALKAALLELHGVDARLYEANRH